MHYQIWYVTHQLPSIWGRKKQLMFVLAWTSAEYRNMFLIWSDLRNAVSRIPPVSFCLSTHEAQAKPACACLSEVHSQEHGSRLYVARLPYVDCRPAEGREGSEMDIRLGLKIWYPAMIWYTETTRRVQPYTTSCSNLRGRYRQSAHMPAYYHFGWNS